MKEFELRKSSATNGKVRSYQELGEEREEDVRCALHPARGGPAEGQPVLSRTPARGWTCMAAELAHVPAAALPEVSVGS